MKGWRRYISLVLIFLVLLTMLTGCGENSTSEQEEQQEGAYQLYYLNKDKTSVETWGYDAQGETTEAQIDEFLSCLRTAPADYPDLHSPFPASMSVTSYELDGGQLSLHLDSGFPETETYLQVLCMSAVVRSLCQIEGVENVTFLVGDTLLMDSNGTPFSSLNADSFVENTGDAINTYTVATLDLYYANAAGDRLVDELVEIRYSSNMSVEKLVVEQLIRGPITDDAYPAISSNTKVLSVSTKDGVCYVNLDEGFLEQEYDVLEAIPIYSIVNSLTEISGINKVQILINGETNQVFRESIRFDTIFERNLDLVETGTEETDEAAQG